MRGRVEDSPTSNKTQTTSKPIDFIRLGLEHFKRNNRQLDQLVKEGEKQEREMALKKDQTYIRLI